MTWRQRHDFTWQKRMFIWIALRTGHREGPGACGLASPLTRMVATPCYRAPEVCFQPYFG